DVQYIMIGGFAVNLHGFSRTTGDLDIWLKDDRSNRINLGKALEQFGYGDISFEDIEFTPGWSNLFIGNGISLDIMTSMVGLEDISFENALADASVAQIFGVQIPFLHINQLIQNKKVTDRPKDKIDIIELQKIIAIRESEKKA
nr:hypothetical protein [Bacteroidota bacterium]